MKVYIVTQTTLYEENFRPNSYKPLKVFLNELDATNYKIDKDFDESIRKSMALKCFNCDADFEDEEVPTCYKSDNIDPACQNSIYEWPCFEYKVEECDFNDEY